MHADSGNKNRAGQPCFPRRGEKKEHYQWQKTQRRDHPEIELRRRGWLDERRFGGRREFHRAGSLQRVA